MKNITLDFETYENELSKKHSQGFNCGNDHGIETTLDTLKQLLAGKTPDCLDYCDQEDFVLITKILKILDGKTKRKLKNPID